MDCLYLTPQIFGQHNFIKNVVSPIVLIFSANSISNYDDEYDDTYDDADIGANDADSVDELGDEEEEDVAEEK